jgi:hypothetical protein
VSSCANPRRSVNPSMSDRSTSARGTGA